MSISASPTQLTAAGGTCTLTVSAGYEYRYSYSNGTYSAWTSASGTPTVTGYNVSWITRNGNSLTIAANDSDSSRSVTLIATFSIGGLNATQKSVTITQAARVGTIEYQNAAVSISANPSQIPASGGTSYLTVSASYQYRYHYDSGSYSSWTNASGTPSISLTAGGTGFSLNGTTVTVSANSSASNRSATYTASFSIGSAVATSKSATITQVGLPNLTVSWDTNCQPSYVAQRGKLVVGNLASGASISSAIVSPSNAATTSISNGVIYVETRSAGSFTVTVTASNNQTGTCRSTSITAPYPRLTASTLYVNPDGAEAVSLPSGGNSLGVGLYNGPTGGSLFSYSSDNGVVVGNTLVTGLVNTCLNPTFSVDGTYKANFEASVSFSNGSFSNVLHLKSLPLAGSFTNDIASTLTGTLATLKFTVAGHTDSGYASATLKGINPFSDWTSLDNHECSHDKNDYGLISSYVSASYESFTDRYYPLVYCRDEYFGMKFVRNGVISADNADFNSSITIKNKSTRLYNFVLSDTVFSEHIGGEYRLHGYVKNQYNGDRYYSPYYFKFRVFVHGAVGAYMTFSDNNRKCSISARFAGNEANFGFNTKSANFVKTNHEEGDSYAIGSGGAIEYETVNGYVGIDQTVYVLSSSTALTTTRVKKGHVPDFEFKDVVNFGVYYSANSSIDDIYYMQGDGPTYYDSNIGKSHGYYVLHRLEGLQELSPLVTGWLN